MPEREIDPDTGGRPVLDGPKRQHYVPKFYLEGFAHMDGSLAVFDRATDQVRRQLPKDTGVVGHFYTVEDADGRKRYEIETMLSTYESKAAPVLRKLDAGNDLSIQERDEFAVFLALAAVRTPDLIDSVQNMNSELIRMLSKATFGDVELAKSALKETKTEEIAEEELQTNAERLAEFVKSDRYTIETSRQWALGVSLSLLKELPALFAGKNWIIHHRDTDKKSFITTDSPLTLASGIGYADPDGMIVFPLSESSALLMSGRDGATVHRAADGEKIRRVNLNVASRCQRFVIGRDVELVKSLATKLRLSKTEWRPRFRMTNFPPSA